jgi:hypothetical protein
MAALEGASSSAPVKGPSFVAAKQQNFKSTTEPSAEGGEGAAAQVNPDESESRPFPLLFLPCSGRNLRCRS